MASNYSSLNKINKPKLIPSEELETLLAQAEVELASTPTILIEAKALVGKAGLSIESDIPSILNANKNGTYGSAYTAGHSNTDHVVVVTGDYVTDRVSELRRNLITRSRKEQPESKSDVRWDKPRAPGERRRRIVREKDLPSAPPEPCQSGYIVFVSQMTAKIRNDRPNEEHDQTKCVQEISKMWRMGLTDAERKYYKAKMEYRKQSMEYRATGFYRPSTQFEKLAGSGVWVRKNWAEKNALERDIATYKTVVFPPRPPELDEEHTRKEVERIERRKANLRNQTKEKLEAAAQQTETIQNASEIDANNLEKKKESYEKKRKRNNIRKKKAMAAVDAKK
jgi:hypothetical protein